MDRALIISCLQAAEAEVANSERLIVNQCKLIWSLERTGQDTTSAIALFREMERMQLEHLDDRDRLRAEFAVIDAIYAAKANAAKANASAINGSRPAAAHEEADSSYARWASTGQRRKRPA
jgi:hypothetical protein